jgi:transposase InsO family protein
MKHSEAEQRAVRAGAIPQRMRAVAIDRFGGPDVLSVRDLSVPVSSAQEVLIALDTAGVGGWDTSFRDGSSRSETKRMPLVLGVDGAGTVVAAGSRVRRFAPGDQVYAYSYDNESERLAALAPALDFYNRFRPHRALAGLTPLQRVNNLSGTNS